MSHKRFLPAAACLLGLFVGCRGVPPPPGHTGNQTATGNEEYDGWLWKSLTGGRKTAAAASADSSKAASAAGATSSGVVHASANLGEAAMPGRASGLSASESLSGPALGLAAPDEPGAGPPPTIPDELPSLKKSVSIEEKLREADRKKEQESGFQLSDLAPENIYKNVKKAAGYGPDEGIARTALKEGEALFQEASQARDAAVRTKKFKEAAGKFATAADRWPDSSIEERALFLKAESEFFSDQYPKAHDTIGGLLKKYSNTRYLDTVMDRQFAIGRYWEQLYQSDPHWPTTPNVTNGSRPVFDTFGYAVQAYERIRQYDPTGPRADDSLMALGNAYFLRGQYENAAYQYDTLRKEYPNSKHQMQAHLFGLQAHMRKYQGTWYDGVPLNDADKVADQTIKQFGDKLGDERDRVLLAKAQILEEKANRDFTMAKYYDNRKYFRSARIYYQSVIDEYPTTQKAKEARKRLEEIRSEPDLPPDHFKWLTGLFGSEK